MNVCSVAVHGTESRPASLFGFDFLRLPTKRYSCLEGLPFLLCSINACSYCTAPITRGAAFAIYV